MRLKYSKTIGQSRSFSAEQRMTSYPPYYSFPSSCLELCLSPYLLMP
jgi:hypothetical protein